MTNDSLITATCSTAGCTGDQPVFLRNVVCPQPAGATCTFYAHLESQVEVTTNDNGLFRFLVDGVAPSPGPTDSLGQFRWVDSDPDSGVINLEARSYAVVARVQNSSNNQAHPVQVDIACQDTDGGGSCTASMGFASVSIAVYTK
jgi:hypothetical protein